MIIMEIVLLFLVGCRAGVLSYDDRQLSHKWSPQYFSAQRSYLIPYEDSIPKIPFDNYRSRSYNNLRSYPLMSNGIRKMKGSFASWTPTWNGISSMDNKRNSWKRSTCISAGKICVYQSGLSAAAMKFPCCSGSTCSFYEGKFVCLRDRDELNPLGPEEEDYVYDERKNSLYE